MRRLPGHFVGAFLNYDCKRKITCTYQRAARYEIMEWEVAERFGKWRNVPEYSETALEG